MLVRLLRDSLRPYRRRLLLVVALQAVQTVAGLFLPALNARIIDEGVLVLPEPNQGMIWRLGGEMLVFAVVQGAFSILAVYHGAKVAMGWARDVRSNLFHQVTEFSAREVASLGAPSLITRITNDVTQVQMLVVMVCVMAISAPITMVFGVVMAMREDVGLSVVFLLAIPVAALVLGTIVSQMVPAFRVMQERIDRINQVLREQISGVRVVRAFVREPEETDRFAGANTELTDVSLRAGRLMAAMFPTVNLLINTASVAVLWLGSDRVDAGDLEIGSLIAYLSYLVQILMSVVLATFMVSMVPRAAVAAGRIMEVLDTEPSVERPAAPVTDPPERGTVELRGAGFLYPGAEHAVLDGVSFRTEPGTTTAIIGSTGSGKTTLLGLVARLFDATEGTVLVDGVDVRQLDPDVLWSVIGLAPQRPYLFAGTVESNLRVGKADATEADMWEALEVAQAADFVRVMGGLEARIEQGGTNVSGGQRQRLSIARALVRKPEVYLFDDSFSALDLATDARLRAALVPYTRDAAVIVVAQRVSTISGADEIVVLDDGVVVGQGTHDELLAGCPTYAEIVESQIGEKAGAA